MSLTSNDSTSSDYHYVSTRRTRIKFTFAWKQLQVFETSWRPTIDRFYESPPSWLPSCIVTDNERYISDFLLVLMKIWICQWNFHWRISNTRLDRMTCLHRRRTHQINTVGILLRQIVDFTYPNRFDVTSRWLSVSYLLSSDPSRKLPTVDFFTFVISRRQYSLRPYYRQVHVPHSQSRTLFKFLKMILPKSSIMSKQKIYSSLLILCWVNPYHRWNFSTFNERRKYLIS